jgi:hypothetical protein
MPIGEGLPRLLINHNSNTLDNLIANIKRRDINYWKEAPFFKYFLGFGGTLGACLIIAYFSPIMPLAIIASTAVAGVGGSLTYRAQVTWEKDTYLLSVKEISDIFASNLRDNNYFISPTEKAQLLIPINRFVVHGVQFYMDGGYKVFLIKEDVKTLATAIRDLIKLPFFATPQRVLIL